MSNDRRRHHEKPVNGPRIDGMTLREHLDRAERSSSNLANMPMQDAPAAIPARATAGEAAKGVNQYDPPWSYLDPDNPDHEHYRQKRAALPSARQPAAVKRSLGPIDELRTFFKENGHKPDFAGISQLIWWEKAEAAGIIFDKKDFAAAWRAAGQSGDVVRLKGAPKKSQQSKRARKG